MLGWELGALEAVGAVRDSEHAPVVADRPVDAELTLDDRHRVGSAPKTKKKIKR